MPVQKSLETYLMALVHTFYGLVILVLVFSFQVLPI